MSLLQEAYGAFNVALPFRPTERPLSIDQLKPYDYDSELAEILQLIAPETCQWILNHESIEWFSRQKTYTVMWMTGSLGSGKTFSSAYLVRSIREDNTVWNHCKPRIVLYTTCNTDDNNTAGTSLCVILHQLLIQVPDLIQSVDLKLFLASRPMNHYGIPRASSDAFKMWETAPDTIWRHICELIQHSDLARVYLVIDGLDNCDVASQKEIFKLLRDGPANMSVLVVSQPLEHIRVDVLWLRASTESHKVVDLDLVEDHINSDIDCVIDRLMTELPRGYSDQQTKLITDFLKAEKSGSFLPSVLIAEQLKLTASVDVHRVLSSASTSLDQLDRHYRKLIDMVPENVLRQGPKVLEAILFAGRPLTISELAHICHYQAKVDGHDSNESIPEAYPHLMHDLKLFGPIIRVRPQDFTVRFFHPSARKFLEERSAATPAFISPSSLAHMKLASLCLSKVIECSIKRFPAPWDDAVVSAAKLESLSKCEFLDYALEYWDYHVCEAFSPLATSANLEEIDEARSDRDHILELLTTMAALVIDESRLSFAIFFKNYRAAVFDNRISKAGPLGFYLRLGLESILDHALLRECLADYNEAESSDTRSYPLSVRRECIGLAALSGNLAVVKTTLAYFKEPPDSPAFGDISLYAGWAGNLKLIEFALKDHEIPTRDIARAALEAAGNSHFDCVKALSTNMTALRKRDASGLTVIHHVVLQSADRSETAIDPEVVGTLLSTLVGYGVSINTKDSFGSTVLHHICWSNSLCTVKLLESLRRLEVDFLIRNKAGQLPLHLGARKADPEAFQFLLSNTIRAMEHVPLIDRGPRDLHNANDSSTGEGELDDAPSSDDQALLRRSVETMSIVERDNRPFQSNGGLTPLHWAMARPCTIKMGGDADVIRTLLQCGFELTAVSSKSARTPLSDAQENPLMMHLLSLVYYRLDGVDHFHIAMAKTLYIFQACSVDLVWQMLGFDRHFGFLSQVNHNNNRKALEHRCIERALISFFILGETIMDDMRQRAVTEDIWNSPLEAMQRGEKLDYSDPKIVQFRQFQVLLKLSGMDREAYDGATVKDFDDFRKLDRACRQQSWSYLVQHIANMNGSFPTQNSGSYAISSTQGSRRSSDDRLMRQTIHPLMSCNLLGEWQRFLKSASFWFSYNDAFDYGAAVVCMALNSAFDLKKMCVNSTMQTKALTKLHGLLITK